MAADAHASRDVAVPGRFRLVRELGAGGMGTVWEAVDRELDVRVALKLLHDAGGEAIERIKHEFRVAADVRHEHLVRLGELFEHEHRWCFSMELVEGEELMAWVAGPSAPRLRQPDRPTAPEFAPSSFQPWDTDAPTYPGFDDDRLRRALAQLAGGLAALHAAGIVHRDVKPSNIRVDRNGRLVLLDLGLAAAEVDLRQIGLFAGTVEYMAPEQVIGDPVGTAADMYAVGAVLYEALVGRPPYVGPVDQIQADKISGDPLPPAVLFPEVATDLDRLCMALLSRNPARRPAAAEVASRLKAYADVSTASSSPLRTARSFVGRTRELAQLLSVGRRERRDAAAVRVVAGPSGIGKTRLLERFAQVSRDGGHLVCFGSCRVREHVRLNAWESLLDGLTRMLSGLQRAPRAALVPDDAEAISRLFPIFDRVLPSTSTSSSPAHELERRALAALRELLGRVAREQEIVVVIDDVQWATPDSLSLFERLLAPPGAPPLALVLGLRASEGPTPELDAWLQRLAGLGVELATIPLGPLDDADARALARLLVDDPERADRLAAATGGHPLFLELMASQDAGGDDLGATLRRRVVDLPAQLRELLGVLAASGAPLRLDLLGAALGRDPFVVVDELRWLLQHRFVRVTGVGRTDLAEPFHAQVGDAVLATTAFETQRADHARLAEAFESLPQVDAERRALHWAWADEHERAARAAIALVTSARHALAYSRAADVCEVVLDLDMVATTRAALQRAYGDALTGSGFSARAAVAYQDAATVAEGVERLELERLAGENFMRVGEVDKGMAHLTRVAAGLGYRATHSPTATIAALLLERARLRLRGTAPRIGTIDAALAARSDACTSLSIGLAMHDAISGALFQTRSTRFALDCGDPARAARALAIEACFVSAWGSRTRARAQPLAEAASKLAAEVGTPELLAVTETGHGICALQWGDLTEAVRRCDAALAIYRERCAGVVWEERTSEIFGTWALAWRGHWGEVARRCDSIARAGEATGDRYASMHAAIGVAVCGRLASDDPERALADIRTVMDGWPRASFDLPQVRELVGIAGVELYRGRGVEVRRLLEARWPALERSRMLGLEPVLGTLADLRVRACLQAGAWDEARRWAAKLARIPWTTGPAALARAALAAQRGDTDAAVAELRTAQRESSSVGLDLHAAAARDRLGKLLGGDEGATAIAAARVVAEGFEIARPERAFTALAPWPARG